MIFLKRFYLIIFYIVLSFGITGSSYGEQRLISVLVGDTKIIINVPHDFTEVHSNTSPEIWKIAEAMTPPTKELLAMIVERDVSEPLSIKDFYFKKYLLVQVSKQFKDVTFSDSDFFKIKRQFKAVQNKLWMMSKDRTDKLIQNTKKHLSELTTSKLLQQDSFPMGIFHERSNSISAELIIKQVIEMEDKKEPYLTAVATNIVFLKGKVLFLYVCNEYNSQVDSGWVKSMSKDWINAVNKSNKENRNVKTTSSQYKGQKSHKNDLYKQQVNTNKIYFKNGKSLVYDKVWKDGNTVFIVVKGKKIAVGYADSEIDMDKSFGRKELN